MFIAEGTTQRDSTKYTSCSFMITIEPTRNQAADTSIIWLHGLGANGHDLAPLIAQLPALQQPGINVRHILPHAPQRPVTCNGGQVMPAWYDIYTLSATAPVDASGINASIVQIATLIDTEIAHGIKPQRIVLIGFSQGGAIALQCGLSFHHPLAGIVALSTYLPLPDTLAKVNELTTTPVLMMHGEHDPIVPYTLGYNSCQHLRDLGYCTQWRVYPMEHTICTEQVPHINQWLSQQLPRTFI